MNRPPEDAIHRLGYDFGAPWRFTQGLGNHMAYGIRVGGGIAPFCYITKSGDGYLDQRRAGLILQAPKLLNHLEGVVDLALELGGKGNVRLQKAADLAAHVRRFGMPEWQLKRNEPEPPNPDVVTRLRAALAFMVNTCGEHIEDVLSAEDVPEFFQAIAEARAALADTE